MDIFLSNNLLHFWIAFCYNSIMH